MASKRRNMFHKNKTQETTEKGSLGQRCSGPATSLVRGDMPAFPKENGGPYGVEVSISDYHAMGSGFDSLRCQSWLKARLASRTLDIQYIINLVPEIDSTIQQCQRVVDNIASCLEQKQCCSVAFLDVAQALIEYGTEGCYGKSNPSSTYYLIISSYLSDRYFIVIHGSSQSPYFPIKAGAPQGSILSSLLYSVYTSDIPEYPTTLLDSCMEPPYKTKTTRNKQTIQTTSTTP
ncbi:hypothetical protein AAG570_011018 [Ranatra chinensis]|uniref:Reverse transcriptase domain-containing protein n=1 Tax=Ranatra chinensis TaxID=642074 RepID=A0ABD0YJD3_9HEMI